MNNANTSKPLPEVPAWWIDAVAAYAAPHMLAGAPAQQAVELGMAALTERLEWLACSNRREVEQVKTAMARAAYEATRFENGGAK